MITRWFIESVVLVLAATAGVIAIAGMVAYFTRDADDDPQEDRYDR